MSTSATSTTVVEWLSIQWGFHFWAESLLEKSFPARFPEAKWSLSPKTPLILRDLTAWGTPPSETSGHPPSAEDFETFGSRPGILGLLYVLEGSTLGGAIIGGHLSSRLKNLPGLSFFFCYGDKTQSVWQEFLGFLESVPLSPEEETEMVRAAQRAFLWFEPVLLAEPQVGKPV